MTWIVPAASFQADNQGTPQEKVVLEIHPFALKNKRAKACFLKIPLHAAGKDALRLLGIQRLLNDARVGPRRKPQTLVLIPVLHHHGNGGRPAGVSLRSSSSSPSTPCHLARPESGRLMHVLTIISSHGCRPLFAYSS